MYPLSIKSVSFRNLELFEFATLKEPEESCKCPVTVHSLNNNEHHPGNYYHVKPDRASMGRKCLLMKALSMLFGLAVLVGVTEIVFERNTT